MDTPCTQTHSSSCNVSRACEGHMHELRCCTAQKGRKPLVTTRASCPCMSVEWHTHTAWRLGGGDWILAQYKLAAARQPTQMAV